MEIWAVFNWRLWVVWHDEIWENKEACASDLRYRTLFKGRQIDRRATEEEAYIFGEGEYTNANLVVTLPEFSYA